MLLPARSWRLQHTPAHTYLQSPHTQTQKHTADTYGELVVVITCCCPTVKYVARKSFDHIVFFSATCVFKSANDYFVLITVDWKVCYGQWTSIVKWICTGIMRHFILVNKDIEVQSKMYFKEHEQPPNNHLGSSVGDISYGLSSRFLK